MWVKGRVNQALINLSTPAHVLLSMKHLLSQDEGYKDGL